jgi:hypothetical protein
MRYWWVNQNQTWRHEQRGGYLWSPKRKANGQRNAFYEFLREVAPGDLVFAFADTWIRAVGIASSYAYEAPKPAEFGSAGRNWDQIGWRVDVAFHRVPSPFRPIDWIEKLRPLLPGRYAPLQQNGHGLQSMYLTELPRPLALALAELAGREVLQLALSELAREAPLARVPEWVRWEEHLEDQIRRDPGLDATQREALVLARRGQGRFRDGVRALEGRCRVTGVDRPEHLRASHIKPWRDSSNAERLDPHNGLLLTPSIDHLFDRGFVSFANDGRLLVSRVAHRPSLQRMGVPIDRDANVGRFTADQAAFLEFHRDAVFLRSAVAL